LAKLTKFKSKRRNCTGDGWGDHSIKLLRKAQLVDFLLQQDPALGTDQHVEEVMAQPFASAKEELLGTYGALPARAWYRDENGVLPDAYKSGQEGLIESTEQRVQRKRRKREADKRRERGLAEKLLKGKALPSHAKLPQPVAANRYVNSKPWPTKSLEDYPGQEQANDLIKFFAEHGVEGGLAEDDASRKARPLPFYRQAQRDRDAAMGEKTKQEREWKQRRAAEEAKWKASAAKAATAAQAELNRKAARASAKESLKGGGGEEGEGGGGEGGGGSAGAGFGRQSLPPLSPAAAPSGAQQLQALQSSAGVSDDELRHAQRMLTAQRNRDDTNVLGARPDCAPAVRANQFRLEARAIKDRQAGGGGGGGGGGGHHQPVNLAAIKSAVRLIGAQQKRNHAKRK
jgi:hypothetical protein